MPSARGTTNSNQLDNTATPWLREARNASRRSQA